MVPLLTLPIAGTARTGTASTVQKSRVRTEEATARVEAERADIDEVFRFVSMVERFMARTIPFRR